VHLVESWGLRATLLFGILLVVFLASLSLPQDIEEKRVFMLITKPLSRPALYAGKWLGFAALLALFLAVMGTVTWGYARFVAWKGGPEASKALDVRERILAPSVRICREGGGREEAEFSTDAPPRLWVRGPGQDAIAWHFKGLTFTAWPHGCTGRTLRVKIKSHVTPGQKPLHVRTLPFTRLKKPLALLDRDQADDIEDGGEIVFDLDTRRFLPDDGDMRVAVYQKPGSERAIGGSPLDATAVLINHFPWGDEIEYKYTSYSTVVSSGYTELKAVTELETLHHPKTDAYTVLVHRSPPLLARWVFADLSPSQFDPAATVEIRLPIKGTGFRYYGYLIVTVRRGNEVLDRRKVRVATNTPAAFPLDPEWIREGEPLVIEVERGEPDTIFILVPDGVALRSRYVAFESGFLRALALVYLELLLLLAIVLPCSTWLSGPVSLFVGIALFICGLMIESIQENLVHVESVIRTTEVLESTQGETHHHGGAEWPLWSLRASRFVLRNAVLRVFPQLHRFDGAPLLLAGAQIPGARIGWAALYVGLYTLVTSILGMLVLRYREFR
ncbi:MAG: hypothetical protein AAB434_13225, partial [Planctomycetota bacterium]